MEQKSIEELVVMLNNEFDADIFEHLVRRFIPLFNKNLKRAPWFNFDFDDYFQEGQIIMYEAIKTFDRTKIKYFTSYYNALYNNHISNIHRSGRALKRGGGIQELPLQYQSDKTQDEVNLLEVLQIQTQLTTPQVFELREVSTKFISKLSKFELEVIMANLAGISRAELARRLRVKESQIQSAFERSRDKLKRLLGIK
ncbi:ECF-type sigma factor [Aerococcaceae bacterium WGS1372]